MRLTCGHHVVGKPKAALWRKRPCGEAPRRLRLPSCLLNAPEWPSCCHVEQNTTQSSLDLIPDPQIHENKIPFCCFFSFFLEREGKGSRKERETSMCGCPSYAPYCGHGPQPWHVPWLGIKPATLWFASQHSIHWATPARARYCFLSHWVFR